MLLFLIPFLVQVAILVFYVIPGKIAIYGSNDDSLLASFSVDDQIGKNSDNWIFIKSLLSMPVTLLQQIIPEVSIYGLVLAFTVIISISAIFPLVNFVKKTEIKITLILILSCVFSIFFIFSVIAPTYTGAAIFSGASGFAILFFLTRIKERKNIDLLILTSVLLSLSYLIRFESFLLSFGFFALLIFIDLIIFRDFKNTLVTMKVPSFILLTIFLLNLVTEQINYSGDDWDQYLALNDSRHSIQLRTAEYVLVDHLEQLDWSESDYLMFKKFSLADPVKINADTLQSAVNVTSYTRGIDAVVSANIKNELVFINYSYSSFYWLIIIILFAIGAIFVGLGRKNLFFLFYTTIILAISILINYVFAVSYHLPYRLTFNFIFLFVVAILVVAISEYSRQSEQSHSYTVLLFLMTALLSISVIQTLPKEFEARVEYQIRDKVLFNLQQSKLSESEVDMVFVGTGSRLLYQMQDPYRAYQGISNKSNFIFIGWHSLSPIWNTQVLQKGIGPNKFHQEFLENENLYWIDDEGAIPLLKDFYQQYTTKEVIIEDMGYLGSEFYRILKISTQK